MDRLLENPQDLRPARIASAAWLAMPSLSVDYAIMENARTVSVLPAGELGWTDIGNWDALMDLYQQHPEFRTGSAGEQYDEGSASISVFREGDSHRVLATIGLENILIVDTDDAILICQRGKSQAIRNIVGTIVRKKPSP
jgi:mannose-1-phosphate guanylyltransferase